MLSEIEFYEVCARKKKEKKQKKEEEKTSQPIEQPI